MVGFNASSEALFTISTFSYSGWARLSSELVQGNVERPCRAGSLSLLFLQTCLSAFRWRVATLAPAHWEACPTAMSNEMPALVSALSMFPISAFRSNTNCVCDAISKDPDFGAKTPLRAG